MWTWSCLYILLCKLTLYAAENSIGKLQCWKTNMHVITLNFVVSGSFFWQGLKPFIDIDFISSQKSVLIWIRTIVYEKYKKQLVTRWFCIKLCSKWERNFENYVLISALFVAIHECFSMWIIFKLLQLIDSLCQWDLVCSLKDDYKQLLFWTFGFKIDILMRLLCWA